MTAGINEQGLVVVNTAANSVPRNKRLVATEDLTQRLLTSFGSVNAVLFEKDLFQKSHPAIYIIGDASKIASIEVAPGGKVSVTVQEKGTLVLYEPLYEPGTCRGQRAIKRKQLHEAQTDPTSDSPSDVPFHA